jgi:membrane-associated phospholipid phosphatase
MLGLGALLGSGAAVQLIKHLVGRPRPRLDLPVWEYFGPTLQSDLLSFPSGHSATSFALASLLSVRHPLMAWPAYLLAGAISAGRVLSNSHHFSDVLGGALVGLAVGWPLSKLLAGSGQESP